MQGVKWKNLSDIEGVFYASSSEEAKIIFSQKQIDILISDIEMPGENGIALLTWVKEHYPDTQYIILTAHAKFEYAHDALKLNCFDYVLQPVNYHVLEDIIAKAVLNLLNLRKNKKLSDQNKYLELIAPDLDVQVWSDFIITGNCNGDMAKKKLAAMDLCFPSGTSFVLILAEDVTIKKKLDEWISNKSISTIEELITAFYKNEGHYQRTITKKDNVLLHLLCTNLKSDNLFSMMQTLADLCQNNYGIFPAIYMGLVESLDDLPDLYQKLLNLKAINVASLSRLFTLSDLDTNICHDLPSTQNWSKHFFSQTTDVILTVLENYLQKKIRESDMNVATLLTLQQCFINEFYISLQMRSINIQDIMNRPEIFDAYTLSVKSVDQFVAFAKKIVEVNRSLKTNGSEVAEDPITFVIKYVNDHIGSDISRQQIAQKIHISESHLSHLFQKRVGQTLSNYIIEQRMQLARSLLIDSSMPIGLVAIKCGYNHFSYFVRTFKKVYGVSPLVFRNMDENEA